MTPYTSASQSGPIAGEPAATGAMDAKFGLRATALLLLVFLVCALWLAMRRGPWLDEIWSLWQSQHDLPLGEIVRQRWLVDFHPPLFSLAHWLAAGVLGDSLVPHRMLNLLALAWAAAFGALTMKHRSSSAPLLLLYAVLMLSLPQTLEYFAESRSYFAQLCLVYAVFAATILILDSDDDLDWRRDRGWALMVAATIIVALNLHYVTSLLIALVLAGLIGWCAWLGRWRWACVLFGACALGCTLLLASFAVQAAYIVRDSDNYWVSATMLEGLRILQQHVTASLRVSELVLMVALAAVCVSSLALTRRRPAGADAPVFAPEFAARLTLAPPRWRSVLLFGAALALFAVAMLVLNAKQPIITGRYLLTFEAGVLAVVAALSAEAVASRRVLFVLAIGVAMASILSQASKTLDERRWDATAQQVSRLLAQCRSSPVYVTLMPRQTPHLQNVQPALRWGYQWQGRRHGFEVIQVAVGAGELPLAPGRCPALLWVEHAGRRLPDSPDDALRRLGLDSALVDLPNASLAVGETGFVLKLPYKAHPSRSL